MNEIKSSLRKDFSTIPNALISDDNLEPLSRFLFIYMASKSDDWQFFHKQLQKALGIKDPRTFRKYMSQLLEAGWISRERLRTDGARFDSFSYTLHCQPVCKISSVQNFHSGKNAHLTNKEPLTNKELLINNRSPKKEFTPPLKEDVTALYAKIFKESNIARAPEWAAWETKKFFEYYEANGWKTGKAKMKNWKLAVTGWANRAIENGLSKKTLPESVQPARPARSLPTPEQLAKISYTR